MMQDEIIKFLEKNGESTTKQICEKIPVKRNSCERGLRKLVQHKFLKVTIIKIPKKKSVRKYELIKK